MGDAMSAIASNCDVPVSVKCRIGVDDRDSYNELCKTFIDCHIIWKYILSLLNQVKMLKYWYSFIFIVMPYI